MPRPVSLDALGPISVPTPEPQPAITYRLPWRLLPDLLNDRSWAPSWAQAPVWSTDPSLVLESLEAVASSDSLSQSHLLDLTGRIARRNAVAAAEVLDRFRDPHALEALVDAWAQVLHAWDERAEGGVLAAAIGQYLSTAMALGLTHGQAVLFSCCPSADLERQLLTPNTTALVQIALESRPTASYRAIGASLGVTRQRVSRVVAVHGDPHASTRHSDATSDRDRIRSLAAQGLSYRAIASEVGCAISSVSRALAAAS
jgi:hypothetical protein